MPVTSIRFSKYHGCGNHFIIIKDSQYEERFLSKLALATSSPQFAVGSDGLMVVGDTKDNIVSVRMYNPDGSRMGMCGNGIRCVMRYCYDQGQVSEETETITFDVHGKRIVCSSKDHGKTVKVNMGSYQFEQEIEVQSANKTVRGIRATLGNPHFVVFDQPVDIPLMKSLETNKAFPDRANIEFVEIISKTEIKVTVWERGAGQTLACGTGASAAAVVAYHTGRVLKNVDVQLPGGMLKVSVDDSKKEVYLLGPTEFVFEGVLAERFSI